MTPELREGRDLGPEDYPGLVRAVSQIAVHPDFPGKRDVVRDCVTDIVDRSRRGRLTPLQRGELLKILLSEAAADGGPGAC